MAINAGFASLVTRRRDSGDRSRCGGALALLATSCQKLQARDQLNKGVQAFKNAQYPQAVENFKKAVELDPDFPTPPACIWPLPT